jgi:hypothetical protein
MPLIVDLLRPVPPAYMDTLKIEHVHAVGGRTPYQLVCRKIHYAPAPKK